MVLEILVQAVELIQAANEINQAAETYSEAVETAKSAAAELANCWEGESQKAFVASQENAYNWHQKILTIVRDMIAVIKKIVDLYEEGENAVKAIMQ